MKILLIFTLFLTSGGGESVRVTGYSGGGVLVKCRYDKKYTSNPKYLCKGPWSNCADQIKTGLKNAWINSGRFSLFDDTRAAQFWVVITELAVEDSGTYQCAVDVGFQLDVYTAVKLNVKEDQDYKKSISVTGDVGGRVNISCKYPKSHRIDPKFLCRRVGTAGCNYKTSVKESRRLIKLGKFSLHDDRAKQIFTVIINRLTERDSGEYWCGVESDWTADHGYKVYITQINLTVTGPAIYASISVGIVLLTIGLVTAFYYKIKPKGGETVTRYSGQHNIDVNGHPPIRQHPYHVSPRKRSLLQQETEYLLENGFAVPINSPWCSPCLLVPKPDTTYRFCTDYRKVNAITVPDSFPLPRMEDCVDRVGSAKFVTKLDLLKGYWQVPLTSRASDISAFATPDTFLQYTVMAFSLQNAPATFQRLMITVLGDVPNCDAYLDDIVVYLDTWEHHMQLQEIVFTRLRDASLVLNLEKCEFGKGVVTYLSRVVGNGMVQPLDAKVQAISSFSTPQTQRELKRFLGMTGYYRCFCKNF
ncbi:hypothetical protein SRHO_G00178330 [Serrasalmus rhombeus]